MANTIKHKRGSGSNPTASDLVAGELAIRTDTGVVFTKKDDGTVAEIAGGGETNLGVSTTTTAVTVTSDTGNNATISEASGSAAGVMSVAHHDKLDGIAAGAQVNVGTDLSFSKSGTQFEIRSSTGTNVDIVAATALNAGIFTSANFTKLDGIETGATADQTASEILTAIKTVDGATSGLDADPLDGQHGSHYLDYNNFSNTPTIPTNNNQLSNGAGYITSTLSNEQVQDIVGAMVSGNSESGITVTYQDGDGTLDFSVASQTDNNFTTTLKNKLDGIASGATNVTNNNQLTNGAGYITSADPTVASGCIYENSQTISSNYSITSGKNAMSAGPITIASGVTVTVTSGSTYTIV